MLARTTLTLAATLALTTIAHADDADLTFTAVDSTYVYVSGDSLTDLESEIDGSTAYCSTAISSASGLTSAGTCGGASGNIGFELAITFPVCSDGHSIDFRHGPDYGRGGALFLDGDELDGAADDLWWAGSWANPAELLTGGGTLDLGYHTLNSIGFEGCCDGPQELQFKTGSGAWTTATPEDLACEYCPAGGALGPADGYNMFVLGDVDVENSDIEGRIAIGGDASFKNYGIGSGLSGGGTTLAVGGDLAITNGQIYGGDADVGGSCTTTGLGVPSGTLTCNTTVGTVASDHAGELDLISGMMDDLAVNGTTTTTSWGGVTLSGSHSELNVFELDLDALGFASWVWNGWINTFNISTPAGSTVVINVRGDTGPLFKNGSINLSGTSKGDIVWNFFDGQDLTVKNVSVPGAILAPKSDITANNGNIEGTLVAASFTGTGELHDVGFDGATCVDRLSYTDTSGDDVSSSIVYDFFDGLDVDSGDFMSVAVDDGTTTRAWCVERADWYVSNYLAEATGPGKHIRSGSWNRWYDTGSGWSSATTAGYVNSFGPNCNGKAYSFCGEWHLGGQRLMVSPGHTGYGETYDYVGSRSADRELTITVGPSRLSACGF